MKLLNLAPIRYIPASRNFTNFQNNSDYYLGSSMYAKAIRMALLLSDVIENFCMTAKS